MGETITFNIQYEKDKIKNVELDQRSKSKLHEKDQQKFEDL